MLVIVVLQHGLELAVTELLPKQHMLMEKSGCLCWRPMNEIEHMVESVLL